MDYENMVDLGDEALDLLSMEDNSCTPNVVTNETIIYALFKKNERDKEEIFTPNISI